MKKCIQDCPLAQNSVIQYFVSLVYTFINSIHAVLIYIFTFAHAVDEHAFSSSGQYSITQAKHLGLFRNRELHE